MKHLRETFTDQEFAELKEAKDRVKMTWHEFIMILKHVSYTEVLVQRLLEPYREDSIKPPKD